MRPVSGRWDGRVMNEHGRPVPKFRPPWSRGWFIIRRADGPAGVVLEARIPGYATAITEHEDQAAAEAAARQAWQDYAAAVAAVTGQDGQEAEPWAER
jgi:hypothetical protein